MFENNNKIILENILKSNNIVDNINNNLEILLQIIPELKDMINFEHKHPDHHLDVFKHTLLALSISPNDFDIRLALLLHDIGKPHSYKEGEIRHYHNHPQVSSEIAFNILQRLKFDKYKINELCYLIKYHDMPITTKQFLENEEITIKRFKIQCCDVLAHNPSKLEKRIKYLNKIYKIINENKCCNNLTKSMV